MERRFNHLVVDNFLPSELHDDILEFALTNAEAFVSTEIGGDGTGKFDPRTRNSLRCQSGLGPYRKAFKTAIKEKITQFQEALGLPAFTPLGLEVELAAHRDGAFYRPHIDTATQSARFAGTSDRMLSTVYYLHAAPKQFSGGELALLPLGPGAPLLIEPTDNRLVAFASIAPHEVRPVVCANDTFSHARFAINCWVHRAIAETVRPA